MRVIYDTSVLGFGEYTATGRTGVYRLVENNVRGLIHTPEVDLDFSAAESMQMLVHAYDYLKNHLYLKQHKLLAFGPLASTYHEVEKLRRKLLKNPISKPERILRRLLSELQQKLDRWTHPLHPRDLSRAQIYHSPYWALPKLTESAPHLKRVLTVHDLAAILHPDKSENGGDFLKSILLSVSPKDWVVCVSESTKRDFLKFRRDFPKDRVQVIHSAASEQFQPITDLKIRRAVREKYQISDEPYFLSVSSLERRKNLLTLVRAFVEFNRYYPDTQLVLAGPSAKAETEIKNFISTLKYSKSKIHFTGFVADEDLPVLYSDCRAFVYPSYYEGFGFPPLEAMQCGAAVITSNTSSMPEVVGNAGIMVNPEDTSGWAEALATLADNSSSLNEMKRWSQEQALNFSWEENTQKLLHLYHQACSN